MKNLWRWARVTNILLTQAEVDCLVDYKQLIIGFSGGLDSTVLLDRIAAEKNLHPKIIALHVNHGLSPQANYWQQHCEAFCAARNLPLIIKKVSINNDGNIEERARLARYEAFAQVVKAGDCLLLAHHQNDQAETLLLQLFRGAGIEGLSAMPAMKNFAKGSLRRPLLSYARERLEHYAISQGLRWIEDESNKNINFSRNYLRQESLPRLTTRWPALTVKLARTAEHCQQAQANLEDLARLDCPSLQVPTQELPLASLKKLNRARLTNVLRLWLKINHVKSPNYLTFRRLITELVESRSDACSEVSWSTLSIKRFQQTLYLLKKEKKTFANPIIWTAFPEPLRLKEQKLLLVAKLSNQGLIVPPAAKIEVKYRQGGERFMWRGQTKALKKLLQDWQVPPWQREALPLIYINEHLACVVGYAISDRFYVERVDDAWQLIIHQEI